MGLNEKELEELYKKATSKEGLRIVRNYAMDTIFNKEHLLVCDSEFGPDSFSWQFELKENKKKEVLKNG